MAEDDVSGTLLIEKRDGWRKLTLNRPDKLNAANEELLHAMLAALNDAEADTACRALLLTGAGRGFCAGQELGPAVMPSAAGPPDLGALAELHHTVVRKLRTVPLPVVCAVNGVAAGAGASYALACDIVLAARSAKFAMAFVKIGLVPDSGASHLLTHRIGEARARALAMLGEAVEAVRAESWGMIWKAVEDSALLPEAEALTASLAKAPTEAIAGMKQLFDVAGSNGLDAQLDLERDAQAAAGRSADYAEGVRAFVEKRAPVFRGRG
ncbi:MAG TPA: enoyl-CoA hydratase-related protein [Acetobacteraceae bacterium]|nr:enoyl-CoA hydratase-related protein [Acetobacteraceae bacterium]